ncbi:MaoC family dehydratase N-terminal domain-containing protein [Streptomyces sp. PSKA54]|uniref:MaoC family dehydratase N-terminal domain-containing protein n=1 Tax=Streptomyces himalayensis subsp. aureolus TaxID=2758039 RepID=A0A7W2D9R6_9ACTN|nr:MaoC family dehydratase N-terminal domain-containing protein [Streptomyces himalayensis]MBA4867232.1 MaoC family dehydratase N-terminal domain-containing protein [Streptomyces himalayensis subsp. aureolus]
MLNPAYTGRTYPPTAPYEVGREKVREFAGAVGAPAGGGDVAPPTFPIVLSMHAEKQVVDDPDFGFDFSRVVHRDQRFEARRPIRVGDRLTVAVEVVAADTVDGNDVVTLRGYIREADGGALVCTTTSTLVSRKENTQ